MTTALRPLRKTLWALRLKHIGLIVRKNKYKQMKICLKELRECLINGKIQKGANLNKDVEDLEMLIKENNELISIFVASIKTSTSKLHQKS